MKKAMFYTVAATFLLGQSAQNADAENLRHNNIRNVQTQIQLLPDLGYSAPSAPAAPSAPSAPTATQIPQNLPPITTQKNENSAVVPVIAKPKPPVVIVPEVQPDVVKIVPPVEQVMPTQPDLPANSIANLSPKTKNIISEIGSDIGSDSSKPEKIVIEAGGFEKAHSDEGEIGDELEEIVVAEQPKSFEISVEANKEPAFSDFEALKKAHKALNVEQYESAIVLYQSVLDKNPDHREAMFGLATAYQKAGRKNRAKDIYKQIIDKYPKYEPALNNLLALAATEAPERALEEFAIIEGRNPDFAGVYAQKAKIYRQQLNLEYAITNLRRALALEPDNEQYRYDLAIIEDENQNYAAAVKLYAELIKSANQGKEIPADKELISDRLNYISGL